MGRYGNLKSIYFLMFAAEGIFAAYFSLYFKRIGFADHYVGWLIAVGPALIILGQPFLGVLSDRKYGERYLLFWLIGGTCLLAAVFPALRSFGTIFLLTGMLRLAGSTVNPLVDSMTLRALEDRPTRYGVIRVYGSYGFGLAGIGAGILVQTLDLWTIFPAYALLMAGTGMLVAGLPAKETTVASPSSAEVRSDGEASFKALFRERKFVSLLIFVTVLQITFAIHSAFFGIYVDELGHADSITGLGWSIGSLVCIPLFILLPKGLDRYGPTPFLMLGGMFYVLRWLASVYFTDTSGILLTQVLHGPSWQFVFAASIEFIRRTTPDSMRATAQSVFSAIRTGVAPVFGGVLGGYSFGFFGGAGMYVLLTGLSVTAVILAGTVLRGHLTIAKEAPVHSVTASSSPPFER